MNFIESTRGSISGGTDTGLVSFFKKTESYLAELKLLTCR